METNLTLLTQDEIDTLVDFLEEKKAGVRMNGEVLPQDSIDKLIRLIQRRKVETTNFDRLLNHVSNEKCLSEAGIREENQICQLIAGISEKGFIELTIKNTATGKTVLITPDGFASQDLSKTDSEWGYSIMPAFFDQIAKIYNLKYTKENLDFVCRVFAEKNFGNKDAELSAAFLPDDGMVSRILEE